MPRMTSSTQQTVVVHHHSAIFSKAERYADLYEGRTTAEAPADLGLDVVVPYNAECSVPFKLVVREDGSAHFAVADIPTECPLCKRAFEGYELRRIANAAIEQHLRMTAMIERDVKPGEGFTIDTNAWTTNVVLDA